MLLRFWFQALSRRSTTGGTARVASSDTTILGELEGVGGGIRGRDVNSNDNPREETIRDIVAEVDVVEHGVRGRALCFLLAKDVVLSVGRKRLRVGVVRRSSLNSIDEILVPEELADVFF